ncbi:hypothetical protein N9251_02925 [Gammaproteobacteria bacterium]|nr:hypothetical protein [Gammaproteobacteria bacterium]
METPAFKVASLLPELQGNKDGEDNGSQAKQDDEKGKGICHN